jgi:uncharacterized protein
MTTILFLHSAGPQGPGEGSSRLLAALREELPDFKIVAPLMPKPDEPTAAAWINAMQGEIEGMDGPFIAIGHSLGGSTLLQVLARHGVPANLKGVVLVAAPFWGKDDWNVAEFALQDGDLAALEDLAPLVILQGDADDVVPADHPGHYRKHLKATQIRILQQVDHEAEGAAPAVAEAVHALVS